MQKWTASNAELVLNELGQRLRLIERLQHLGDSVKADELHDLQPLFERGLWMFGPEYDAVDFYSNQYLATIVRRSLGGEEHQVLNRRPDFVAFPDRSIGVYSAGAARRCRRVLGYKKDFSRRIKERADLSSLKRNSIKPAIMQKNFINQRT